MITFSGFHCSEFYLRNAVGMQPGRHVQVDEREGDFGRNFGAKCELVPEPLQVDAQRVREDGHAGIFEAVAKLLACKM